MRPRLLCCHTPFGRNPDAVKAYLTRHEYDGVEWGLEGWRLMMPRVRRQRHLERLREAAPLCSLHAPYSDLEIGHRDGSHAAAAVQILKEYVDAAAELGAHHLNLHVGSFAPDPEDLCRETLVRNLAELLNHAARRGTALTVENLRHGPTSDPEVFAALLRATGAPVTFDLGHARGCAWVQAGRGSVRDFLQAIPTRILAGHLYYTERDDTHFAPEGVEDLADALDGLREAGCDFWVLELHSCETLEQTRRVVEGYLAARGIAGRAGSGEPPGRGGSP